MSNNEKEDQEKTSKEKIDTNKEPKVIPNPNEDSKLPRLGQRSLDENELIWIR